MKKINYFLLVILVFLYSCIDKEVVESKIADCINTELNSNSWYVQNNLDVYDMVDEIDDIIFKDESLNANPKELYLAFFDNTNKYRTNDIKSKLEKLLNDVDKFAFVGDQIILLRSIKRNCMFKVLDSTDVYKMNLIALEYEMIDSLVASESILKRKKIYKDWISKIPKKDFEKRFNRFQVAILVVLELLYE